MQQAQIVQLFAASLFVLVIALEAVYLWRRSAKGYPWREALATFATVLPRQMIQVATASAYVAIATFAFDHRIADFRVSGPVSALAAFLAFEFLYYWNHRWMHTVRWFWATHSVHHSANHMNFSVALRLGWTNLLSGSFFVYFPLGLLGIDPATLFALLGLNLFFQFWLHTETVPRLGPLEWVLNTPAHHRVHHASNAAYLDKNFGGTLIVFDRLFGTFAKDTGEPIRYGLTTPLRSHNPLVIALHEWMAMARDLRRARSWRDVVALTVGRPSERPQPTVPA